jgi:ABC-type multidrug transport system ATPase subunit
MTDTKIITAFYGEVSGNIKINGQDKSMNDISDSIGFVPQVSFWLL